MLAPAVAAARSAVASVEADDVPASLRRVRAHTGGRLPPPLIVSIVTALDEDEDFRMRAAAELPADHADSASAAFLTRDAGWWDRLAAAAAEVRVAGVQRTADRAAAATEKATARQEEAVRRLKAVRAEVDAAREQPCPTAVGPPPSYDASEMKEMKARIAALETRVAADAEDRRDNRSDGRQAPSSAQGVDARQTVRHRDKSGPSRLARGRSARCCQKSGFAGGSGETSGNRARRRGATTGARPDRVTRRSSSRRGCRY